MADPGVLVHWGCVGAPFQLLRRFGAAGPGREPLTPCRLTMTERKGDLRWRKSRIWQSMGLRRMNLHLTSVGKCTSSRPRQRHGPALNSAYHALK